MSEPASGDTDLMLVIVREFQGPDPGVWSALTDPDQAPAVVGAARLPRPAREHRRGPRRSAACTAPA